MISLVKTGKAGAVSACHNVEWYKAIAQPKCGCYKKRKLIYAEAKPLNAKRLNAKGKIQVSHCPLYSRFALCVLYFALGIKRFALGVNAATAHKASNRFAF